MKTNLLSIAAIAALSTAAQATVYLGNGNSGFGGPVGLGSLELTTDGTTLSGTLNNNGIADTIGNGLVIYIDSQAGGFNTTSTFDDSADNLRKAMSGFDGTTRSILNFSAGFNADYAIAIGPNSSNFAGLWSLSGTGAHGFISSANLAPTAGAGPYTFSIALSDIGSPLTSFTFASTYGNFETDVFRSNEAYNSISGTGNPGTATATAGFNTFAVPEPSSMALAALGSFSLLALRRRQK